MIGDCIAWLCSHLGPFGLLLLDAVLAIGYCRFVDRIKEW